MACASPSWLSAGYERLAYKRFLAFNLLGNLGWVLLIFMIGSGMKLSHHYYRQYGHYWLFLAVSVFCRALADPLVL